MRAEVTAASRCAVTATLATLAGLGPYFTATTGDPGPGDWRPVRDLYDDAHALAGVAGHVGARIGSTEYRVAASTLFLGYAARLWSLTLGGIVRAGILPDADRLLWRDTDGRIDLHLAEPVGWGGTGLVDVEITGGSRDSSPLEPEAGTKIAVIASTPSKLEALFEDVPQNVLDNLCGGFGKDVWKRFRSSRDVISEDAVRRTCASDPTEIDRILDEIERLL